MESICCNAEIPAVTVCPERDYRIFLNWSSVHLSIKIRSQRQEPNSSIKCTWGIYNTQQGCYNQPLKRAYFWNFIIPAVPCFYTSHRIGCCWHPPAGNTATRRRAAPRRRPAARRLTPSGGRGQRGDSRGTAGGHPGCRPAPPRPSQGPCRWRKELLERYGGALITSASDYFNLKTINWNEIPNYIIFIVSACVYLHY